MAQADLELFAKEKADRVDSQFAGLVFATLALSVQFSNSLGTSFPFVLIASWVFLVVSAYCGCWRITRGPVFDRLNHQRNAIRRFIRDRQAQLLDQAFVAAIAAGRASDPDDLRPLTLEGVRAGLEQEKAKLVTAEKLMEGISSRFPRYYDFQVCFFVCFGVANRGKTFSIAGQRSRVPAPRSMTG